MRPWEQTSSHPMFTRRTALQAGTTGLLGLGMNPLAAVRAMTGQDESVRKPKAHSVIYISLVGGLSQIDSFDPKPDAPAEIRGEFRPIATRAPGIHICEHLPRLAQRSHRWALVRSLSHTQEDHQQGTDIMLSGRSFPETGPSSRRGEHPSITAVVGAMTRPRNNLPSSAILPVHMLPLNWRVLSDARFMGAQHEPWFIEAVPQGDSQYLGASPGYEFMSSHRQAMTPLMAKRKVFQASDLALPEGLEVAQLGNRIDLLKHLDQQRHDLNTSAAGAKFDRCRQRTVDLMMQPRMRQMLDVTHADERTLERYGRHSFGWSLLMARRLIEVGVNMVQVNLGQLAPMYTWDTHGEIFPNLRELLLPPMDQAVSGLLDDLHENGLLDSTLVVMASEIGRAPKIAREEPHEWPGRKHWGIVQTVFFAGGGVRGGTVVGSTDKTGGYPKSDRQTPENLAATIYHALGIPESTMWHDALGQPRNITYFGTPIAGLF